jgi:hypothetical protein
MDMSPSVRRTTVSALGVPGRLREGASARPASSSAICPETELPVWHALNFATAPRMPTRRHVPRGAQASMGFQLEIARNPAAG